MKPSRTVVPFLVVAVVALSGCKPTGDEQAPDAVTRDATDTSKLNGVSARQLEQAAEPMSPEQARQLGIDSAAFEGSANEAVDTNRAGIRPAARDSVPPAP